MFCSDVTSVLISHSRTHSLTHSLTHNQTHSKPASLVVAISSHVIPAILRAGRVGDQHYFPLLSSLVSNLALSTRLVARNLFEKKHEQ